MVNWILKPPSEIIKDFEFSFDDIGKSLFSEININCDNNFFEKNCIYLGNNEYNVKLSLQLMRNQAFHNDKYRNFEVQLNFLGLKKKETFKKVLFVERYDYLIELIFDFFNFPFRLLGYMNHHNMIINFIEDFDNAKFNLEKIEILINDHLINIKKASLILIPYVGWIKYFLSLLRFILIPLVFIVSIFLQISTYIGIRIILSFIIINEETNENVKALENTTINTSLVESTPNSSITEVNNILLNDLSQNVNNIITYK